MSTTKYDELEIIDCSRRDWKIRVKVVRFWRGYTKQGQPFNNFNIILIDKQGTKIQAFIPAKCNDLLEKKLALGNVCSMTNFDVELYKSDDRFRTVFNQYRIILGEDTKVKLLDEMDGKLPDDTYDFYDHEDLLQIANDNVHLTDVVGIIPNKSSLKLNQVVNRLSQAQTQLKFSITDGRSNVNVTLWDATAKKVYEELQKPLEEPVIIILAAAKVGKWKDEVDLSHVAATHFYFNHDHHTVNKIRKMLQDPVFSQTLQTGKKGKEIKMKSIAQLKQLGLESVQVVYHNKSTKKSSHSGFMLSNKNINCTEIVLHIHAITHVVVKYVDDKEIWFLRICTKCKKQVSNEGEQYRCKTCNRLIPYPEKRYQISIVAADNTGGIEIKLQDRPVRNLIGKRAQQVYDEQKGSLAFPSILKDLQNKEITVQLSVTADNVQKQVETFLATNACWGFSSVGLAKEKQLHSTTSTSQKQQCSASTYHLDGISQLNVESES